MQQDVPRHLFGVMTLFTSYSQSLPTATSKIYLCYGLISKLNLISMLKRKFSSYNLCIFIMFYLCIGIEQVGIQDYCEQGYELGMLHQWLTSSMFVLHVP